MTLWGTGSPRREFLHSDDSGGSLPPAPGHLQRGRTIINVGSGTDVTIKELAGLVRGSGRLRKAKSSGTPPSPTAPRASSWMAPSIRALGWQPRIGLPEGIADAYRWFLANRA